MKIDIKTLNKIRKVNKTSQASHRGKVSSFTAKIIFITNFFKPRKIKTRVANVHLILYCFHFFQITCYQSNTVYIHLHLSFWNCFLMFQITIYVVLVQSYKPIQNITNFSLATFLVPTFNKISENSAASASEVQIFKESDWLLG